MAKFTVRVELHNCEDKYDELHDEMGKERFYRVIQGDGTTVALPHAEYSCDNSGTADNVLTIVKRVLAKIGIPTRAQGDPDYKKTYSSLVTKSDGPRSFVGLKQV